MQKLYLTRSIDHKMLQKVQLVMKLSIMLFFIGTICLYANGYAQDTRVNLHLKGVSLTDVFREIEKQSDFRFFYNSAIVNTQTHIDLNANDEFISDLLAGLFKGTDINYRMVEKYIVITQNNDDFSDLLNKTIVKQGITVTGTVTDNSGPMTGVNVVVKGTLTGVVTDIDGKYTITVPGKDAVLVFSFIGYTTNEYTVGDQREINVALKEDTHEIEEVVVVGYGTQRKSDVTGSIAVVDSKDLVRSSSFSALEGLKGIASGVNVFVNSGMPGGNLRVVIRGQSSINAYADPLYVVDGVPTGDFQFLNPNDIERIEVLKDASSTAIYGARGAQGVILVTTRRGAQGERTTVSYNGTVSLSTFHRPMDTFNSADYMKAYKIGMQNAVKYGGWSEQAMTDRWTRIAQNSSLNPDYFDLSTCQKLV